MPRRTQRAGIYARMLAAIAPAAILPLLVLVAVSSVQTYRMVSEETFRFAGELVQRQAGLIEVPLTEKIAIVRTLAQSFERFREIPSSARRGAISAELQAALKGNPDVLAAWTTWEPGGIEDDPAPYRGTSLDAPGGGFNATWFRSGGAIIPGIVDEHVYEGSYYTAPKALMRETVVAPYYWSYTGKKADEILETTLCVPIVVDGIFKGVVGFDVELGTYQRLVAGISIFGTGYAALSTGDGTRVAHQRKELVGTVIGDDLSPDRAAELRGLVRAGKFFVFRKDARATGAPSQTFWAPVHIGRSEHWMLAVVVPLGVITQRADSSARILIGIGIAAVLMVVGAILLAAGSLARPIVALTGTIEGMESVSSAALAPDQGIDELNRLAASFNAMAARLRESVRENEEASAELAARNENLALARTELRSLNEELEKKVSTRTAELERTLEDLRAAQEKIVASEKFALLGRVSAGLAHELNTPLAAIRSSVEFLANEAENIHGRLTDFAEDAEPKVLEAFRKLLGSGMKRAEELAIAVDRAERRKLMQRLAAAGYVRAEFLADAAAALGALSDQDTLFGLLERGRRDAIVLAADLCAIARARRVIWVSAEKAATTVAALEDYARAERFEISQTVDPAKEIDSLIQHYFNESMRHVQIVRDYAYGIVVLGYRDRLNQVWVNLMNNAIQAMDYRGILSVGISAAGGFMAVSFADTGRGIPAEIQPRIFEPFFTTKRAGEGTGLGLDICKKIIEKHGGDISFVSEPGRTVFTVRLPLGKSEL